MSKQEIQQLVHEFEDYETCENESVYLDELRDIMEIEKQLIKEEVNQ